MNYFISLKDYPCRYGHWRCLLYSPGTGKIIFEHASQLHGIDQFHVTFGASSFTIKDGPRHIAETISAGIGDDYARYLILLENMFLVDVGDNFLLYKNMEYAGTIRSFLNLVDIPILSKNLYLDLMSYT